ncbi:MAG: hypothetical protein PHT80_07335 [Lentisphaeria bacterium]|nr:hypothetical protein [Lentisphaeria bacterium]
MLLRWEACRASNSNGSNETRCRKGIRASIAVDCCRLLSIAVDCCRLLSIAVDCCRLLL